MVYNTERKRKNKNLLINAQGGFCGRSSIVPTLTSKMGTGGDNIPLISYASQSYADWKISNIGATLKSSGGIMSFELKKQEEIKKWAATQKSFEIFVSGKRIFITPNTSFMYIGWEIYLIEESFKEFIKFLKGENIPTNEQIIITVKNYFDE